MTCSISKGRAARVLAWGLLGLLANARGARASEFEITADSFTVDKQVNLSSAAYFQGQASAPGNPAAATQLASLGGLYFDGTYYNVWDRTALAWVKLATGTIVTGTVAVANGGTGATTAAGAQTNLDVPSRTGSGASGSWTISVSGTAGGAPPTGAAGGNLGGTYPNPSIATLPAISGANLTNLTGGNVVGNIPGSAANVTGIVGVANGGTGLMSPGTSGNYLGSTGSNWTSRAEGPLVYTCPAGCGGEIGSTGSCFVLTRWSSIGGCDGYLNCDGSDSGICINSGAPVPGCACIAAGHLMQ